MVFYNILAQQDGHGIDLWTNQITGNHVAVSLWDKDIWSGKLDQVTIFDYCRCLQAKYTTLWGGGTSVSSPMAGPSPAIASYQLGTSARNRRVFSTSQCYWRL